MASAVRSTRPRPAGSPTIAGQQLGVPLLLPIHPGKGTGLVIMTNGLGGGELWTRMVKEMGDY